MPNPFADETLHKIAAALQTIETDPQAPRTKEHLARTAGVGHATIHRVFKWDAETEQPTDLNINERWRDLTNGGSVRRSPTDEQIARLKQQLGAANKRISELEQLLTTAQTVAAAAWLAVNSGWDDDHEPVSSIVERRNRRRN